MIMDGIREPITDGGPAFPTRAIEHYISDGKGHVEPVFRDTGGMSLRDWFAGQALTYLAHRKDINIRDADHIAALSFQMADVMLAQRAKEPR